MAASPVIYLGDVVYNVNYELQAYPALLPLVAIIEAWRIANSGYLANRVTLDAKDEHLKRLTGCTVALDPRLNCYPRGLAETTCFDLDGRPVP